MAIRNFWIDGEIDGRMTPLCGGPKSRDGGFKLTITMREDGGVSSKRIEILGCTMYNGDLVVDVCAMDGGIGRCVYHEEVTP